MEKHAYSVSLNNTSLQRTVTVPDKLVTFTKKVNDSRVLANDLKNHCLSKKKLATTIHSVSVGHHVLLTFL